MYSWFNYTMYICYLSKKCFVWSFSSHFFLRRSPPLPSHQMPEWILMTCFGNLKDIIQWHPLYWYISIYTKTSLSSKPGCSVLAGQCQQHYTPHRQPWQSSFTWLVCYHLPFVVRLCMCDGSSKEFASYVQLANKISYLWWNKTGSISTGVPSVKVACIFT